VRLGEFGSYINLCPNSRLKIHFKRQRRKATCLHKEWTEERFVGLHCHECDQFSLLDQLLINTAKIDSIEVDDPSMKEYQLFDLLRRVPKWTGLRQMVLSYEKQLAIASLGRRFRFTSCCFRNDGEGIIKAMMRGPVSIEIDGDLFCASSMPMKRFIERLERIEFEHEHYLYIRFIRFDAATWRRLARVRIHRLKLEIMTDTGFLEELASNPQQGPKELEFIYFKCDAEAWSNHLIQLLRWNVIVGLTVIFGTPELYQETLSWKEEGWIELRQSLSANHSLQRLTFYISAHIQLRNEHALCRHKCIEYLLGEISNHPSLQVVDSQCADSQFIDPVTARNYRRLVQQNPGIRQLLSSSHRETPFDWTGYCKPALIENKVWPRFRKENMSNSVYAHAMLLRARKYPSLFYRCLRHRGLHRFSSAQG